MRQTTVFFSKDEANPKRAQLTRLNVQTHIIQQGSNRQPCFYADENDRFHSQWQEECSQEYDSSVNTYMLMASHFLLLIIPKSFETPDFLMKRHGHRYVKYIDRSGRVLANMFEHPTMYPRSKYLGKAQVKLSYLQSVAAYSATSWSITSCLEKLNAFNQ